MKTVSYDVHTLFGDHHVIEIRRILLQIPGVLDVYASSAFHLVEVTYDPAQTNDLQIAIKLDAAGYLGEWTVPVEPEAAAGSRQAQEAYFRHTAVHETTRHIVSFAQKVPNSGRPLWTCPGMGVIHTKMEE